MKFPSKEELMRLRETYKPGTVVELTSTMEDPYHPLPAGLRGEVTGVDDAGDILMRWSNGSSLSLISGEDDFRIVVMSDKVKEQILALRIHPEAPNMFETNAVQVLANNLGYYDLVIFLEEHRSEYAHFIMTGEAL